VFGVFDALQINEHVPREKYQEALELVLQLERKSHKSQKTNGGKRRHLSSWPPVHFYKIEVPTVLKTNLVLAAECQPTPWDEVA
jgi:hypothetical protein